MPDALEKIQTGVDKARTKLAAQRLGGRESDVVVTTYTQGDAIAGTVGTWGGAITLSPRPVVRSGGAYRIVDGVQARIGDVEVRGISRTYTETQLRGAAGAEPTSWTIAGRSYSLVELDARPTEWIAALRARGE